MADNWHVGESPFTPNRKHVEDLVAFFPRIKGPLLVHCAQAYSRSPAAALLYLAYRMGVGREQEALDRLYQIKDDTKPNHLIVALGDHVLGHNGALFRGLLERTDRGRVAAEQLHQ